ncbi:restriction endonuclease subunit S [Acinetobacter bereziniae]|uniref:restriction endonuclease subunit S n=1 Tax=Acinetobacter bereziniae TaxID=106648 RepID=UPI003AF77D61
MEKQKCPELRFSQFKNDWNETTLGDVVDIIGGGTPDTNVPEFWNGDIDWYSPTEIGENVYANGSIKKITVAGLKNSSAKILPAKKTVLFSSRAGIGEMAILNKPAATNQGFQSFIANNIDVYFLYSMGAKIKKFALSKASGSTFLEISRNQLAQMEFFAPSVELGEQTQIGHFFQNLDQSIALHEKKLAQTQNLKKAMLEKMFPKAGSKQPEIRLKGFSGDWEKKLLQDEVEFFSGLTYSPDDLTNKNGTLVLRSSNVQNNQICTDDNVYVVHDAVNVCNVEVGDIIVVVRNGSRSLIGKHAVINKQMKNTVIGAFMTGVKAKNPYFINALFDTSLFDLAVSRNLGATINQITTGMFKQMEFKFPDKTEQIAIGQFFKKIDETLVLQQQQLQTLKNLKQAFLEKMFV